jgi:hypothetical protein
LQWEIKFFYHPIRHSSPEHLTRHALLTRYKRRKRREKEKSTLGVNERIARQIVEKQFPPADLSTFDNVLCFLFKYRSMAPFLLLANNLANIYLRKEEIWVKE